MATIKNLTNDNNNSIVCKKNITITITTTVAITKENKIIIKKEKYGLW